MAKGCVYIPKTGKDAGKVFGSKESLAAHMNYTPALTDLMSKFQQSGGKADIDSVTKWLGDNGYLKEKPKGKPGRRERLAKLFEEPKVEVAPAKEAGVEATPEMTPEEIRINMKPITDEMAGIEMQFSNSGYSIDWDYDNEIIITDKNGEIVDAEELPKKLLPLAAQYEKATAGLAGYDFDSYQKALEQSRKDVGGIETEFEEVKPLAITEKATEEAPQPKPQAAQTEMQMPERVVVEKNNENINSLIAKKSRYNSLPKTKKAIGANLLEKIKREAADMGFSVITTSGLNIKIVDAQTRKPISKRGVSRTSNKEYIQKKREAQSLAETGQLGLRASILNYFIGGKKIKSSQSELGEGSAEIKSAERKGLVSTSAESIDGIAKGIISNIYGDIENAPEGMEDNVITELQDVLATHEDRVSMEEELFDLYEKLIKDQEEAARYNTAEDADSAMDEGLLDEDSLVEYYETQSQINKLTENEQEKLYRELYPEAFEQEAESTSGVGDVEGTTREAQEPQAGYEEQNVKDFYYSVPGLSKIGTLQQYASYLNTIFPNSKVKEILYRGYRSQGDKGKYFTPNKDYTKTFGSLRKAVVVNAENLLDLRDYDIEMDEDLIKNTGRDVEIENLWVEKDVDIVDLIKKADAIVGIDSGMDEIAYYIKNETFELGTKQDLDAFEKFVTTPSVQKTQKQKVDYKPLLPYTAETIRALEEEFNFNRDAFLVHQVAGHFSNLLSAERFGGYKDIQDLSRKIFSLIEKDGTKKINEIVRLSNDLKKLTDEKPDGEEWIDVYKTSAASVVNLLNTLNRDADSILFTKWADKNLGFKIKEGGYDVSDLTKNLSDDMKKLNATDVDKIIYAYGKAKEDGSNPELVKAVEDLIGNKKITEGPNKGLTQEERGAEKSKSKRLQRAEELRAKAQDLRDASGGTLMAGPKLLAAAYEAYATILETTENIIEAIKKFKGTKEYKDLDVNGKKELDVVLATDAVEEEISSGRDPQEAVDDLIGSQDWYQSLSANQKEQLDEILKDDFGVTPVTKTGIKATIANIIDNYYKGDRQSKLDNKRILESDPKLKYIYDNISKINKQLQDAGVITDKTDGCP
jgi:hypothetical protein